jgi:NAD(P)-dependent dehydrogenase (short-subunit alcohol dehydrogenase family)
MSSIALVTGGNRGIGLAIAHSLKAAGHEVVVTYRSGSAPDGFKSVQMDVTSTDSVDAGFTSIEEQWGYQKLLLQMLALQKMALLCG